MKVSDIWLKKISVYPPHTKHYKLARTLLNYCAKTNQKNLVNNYIMQLIDCDHIAFIKTLELLDQTLGINQYSINLFKRNSDHFTSVLKQLAILKEEGIQSNEVTDLMATLYDNYDEYIFFPDFNTDLLLILKKFHHAQELYSSVVTLLKAAAPVLEPPLQALSLLKVSGLYQTEYIEILSYGSARYSLILAQILILLQEGNSLNLITLEYLKNHIPCYFLESLEILRKGDLLNNSAIHLLITTNLGFPEYKSELLAFIALSNLKINFDLNDLFTYRIGARIVGIDQIKSLTQEVYDALKDSILNPKYSLGNSIDYLICNPTFQPPPGLVLRLCRGELTLSGLQRIVKADTSKDVQVSAQKTIIYQGFIHQMNKSENGSKVQENPELLTQNNIP